jgi:hypothetical protein
MTLQANGPAPTGATEKEDKTMPKLSPREQMLRDAARMLRDDPRAAVELFEPLPGGTQVAMLTALFASRPTWFLRAVLAAIGDLIEEHPHTAAAMFEDPMKDGLDDDEDVDDLVPEGNA